MLIERMGFFKLEVDCPKCFGKKKERNKTDTEKLKEKLLR